MDAPVVRSAFGVHKPRGGGRNKAWISGQSHGERQHGNEHGHERHGHGGNERGAPRGRGRARATFRNKTYRPPREAVLKDEEMVDGTSGTEDEDEEEHHHEDEHHEQHEDKEEHEDTTAQEEEHEDELEQEEEVEEEQGMETTFEDREAYWKEVGLVSLGDPKADSFFCPSARIINSLVNARMNPCPTKTKPA